jgi:hypothetical protein
MRRNIARAYDCLQKEHNRVRTACVKILSRNDRAVERELLRANLDDPKHHDPVLLYDYNYLMSQHRETSRLQVLDVVPP